MASSIDSPVDLRSLETVSEYDGHLMCPICHCPFVNPVQLNCDHIFCQACLDTCIRTSNPLVRHRTLPDNFLCPTCRLLTNSTFKRAPRLVVAMCDDILVKCPYTPQGCKEVIQRGYVQSHVDKYCAYKLIECLDEACDKMIRVKDMPSDNHCVHQLQECDGCGESVMELEFDKHKAALCSATEMTCSTCGATLCRREYADHIKDCSTSACQAAAYGCPVTLHISEIEEHEKGCPLVTLGPYLENQSSRIASMETTIRQLQQRNEVLEEGIASIRSSLQTSRPSSALGTASSSQMAVEDIPSTDLAELLTETTAQPEPSTAGNTNTTTYLLSIHESLREEVSELTHALSDLDARANMTIMNENLRLREDMAHISAGLNTVRMQVHMLINSFLHQGQRPMGTRPAPTVGNNSVEGLNSPGPSSSVNPRMNSETLLSTRRQSDSRESTKL
ncbi:predicted protein [Uncinocarpus reesii 1704]|uniref:TRAF-type domain-containing protein n=1 Tax=Uncinocarpus reesii (strain UAMH 1704) TaxID=336963 RepID=C4JDF4_UNCRE|nr:uncharacterized protein UREG_00372 [Uncinocarpus reesii 1704]EEP75526.1 predicted protein [Uncinocarpus reesii 1704]